MLENIIAAGLGIIAVGAVIWGWWYDNKGTEKKHTHEKESRKEEKSGNTIF